MTPNRATDGCPVTDAPASNTESSPKDRRRWHWAEDMHLEYLAVRRGLSAPEIAARLWRGRSEWAVYLRCRVRGWPLAPRGPEGAPKGTRNGAGNYFKPGNFPARWRRRTDPNLAHEARP